MLVYLPKLFSRYWIGLLVLCFALLSAYTSSPIYGQSATPTPDVNTVPRPEELVTPTNTPFPTPTPEVDQELPGNDNSDDDDNFFDPTPTPFPDFNDDNNDNDEFSEPDNSGGGGALPGGDFSESEPGSESDENGNGTSNSDNSNVDAPSGFVNAVTLNIRRGPSIDAPRIDTIFLNEPVAILSRDSGGEWWYICCGSGSGREGWVSAEFITPDLDRETVNSLLTISANSAASTEANEDTSTLLLEMRPSPAFAWQGQEVTLALTVRNLSDEPVSNVRLRNDLPPALTFIDSDVNDGGELTTRGQADDGIIYTIDWDEIPANSSVSATITVQITAAAVNGMLIDNLAVVESGGGASALAGITLAMPPTNLPLFR